MLGSVFKMNILNQTNCWVLITKRNYHFDLFQTEKEENEQMKRKKRKKKERRKEKREKIFIESIFCHFCVENYFFFKLKNN